ncbi:MAG: hypothetical protein WCK35_14455, partial [Chloroflexota bacterium]
MKRLFTLITLAVMLTLGVSLLGLYTQPVQAVRLNPSKADKAAVFQDIPADPINLDLANAAIRDIQRSRFAVMLPDQSVSIAVDSFIVTSPSNKFDIPITAFTATDFVDSLVTGYLVTTNTTPPQVGDSGWSGTAPITYTFAEDGSYTLYPWAKDEAGNVSAVYGFPQDVVVDTVVPVVSAFSAPTSTNSQDI